MNTTENQKKESIVMKILEKHAGFSFKLNKAFYNSIEINQKRFGMLCRKEVSPTLDELKAICKYFNAEISQFIN